MTVHAGWPRMLVILALSMLVVVLGGAAPAVAQTAGFTRMVGKGSLAGDTRTGGKASYAYIVPCDAPEGSSPPFEIRVSGGRYAGQRFRLTSLSFVQCSGGTAGTPAQLGGFGFFASTNPVAGISGTVFIWRFDDGGPGGANDRAALTSVEFPGRGDVFFPFPSAVPGAFPGSSQPTGFNTAQLIAVPAAARSGGGGR